MTMIADEIAGGLVSYEMKSNIKREFEEELKEVKGLMNESYQMFLIPMIHEVQESLMRLLKADK